MKNWAWKPSAKYNQSSGVASKKPRRRYSLFKRERNTRKRWIRCSDVSCLKNDALIYWRNKLMLSELGISDCEYSLRPLVRGIR